MPEVLLSGHHANIEKWRMQKAMETTLKKRPDMIKPGEMSKKEAKIYREVLKNNSLQTDETVV